MMERLTITITPTLLARLDDFRFENRVGNRSEAARQLLDRALAPAKPAGRKTTRAK
jgi:metal-responsive CopG/Arc/MetJ family transcriptional regulator